MNKFLQIVCYLITFLLAFEVGNFFEFLIPSETYTLQNSLPGKPLPGLLVFFINNHYAVSYFFLFPWLGFIGLPLLSGVRGSYWDASSYLLRFSVFVSTEVFLICLLACTCYSPFIGIITGMSDKEPELTWVEHAARGLFWATVLYLLVALVMRLFRKR